MIVAVCHRLHDHHSAIQSACADVIAAAMSSRITRLPFSVAFLRSEQGPKYLSSLKRIISMAVIRIVNLLKLPQLWRYVGFMSSVVGVLCYALSSSFKHLFGEWNLLKIILYGVVSFIICTFMIFAKKWKLSCSLMLKAHMGFLVLMVTSVYSFFYDKAVNGKTDVLGLISCGAFAFMSFSLSRQIELGFEVDLLNFFLGCLTVQLMKINLMLAFIGAIFCYFLILLRSSLDSQAQQQIGTITITDHVAVQVDAENGLQQTSESDDGSNTGFISGDTNHQQKLRPFCKRLDDTNISDHYRKRLDDTKITMIMQVVRDLDTLSK